MFRITLATDLKEASAQAFRYVIELTRDLRAEIHVAHVVATQETPSESEQHQWNEALRHFSTLYPDLEDARTIVKCQVDTELGIGDTARVLMESAKTHSADIVVVGARRPPALLKRLFGHVAQQLIFAQEGPVLMIPQGAALRQFRKIALLCFTESCETRLIEWKNTCPIMGQEESYHLFLMPTFHARTAPRAVPRGNRVPQHLISAMNANAVLDAASDYDCLLMLSNVPSAEKLIRDIYDRSPIPVLFI